MKNRPPVSYLDPPVYYESANLETPLFIWDPPVYSAGESMVLGVKRETRVLIYVYI